MANAVLRTTVKKRIAWSVVAVWGMALLLACADLTVTERADEFQDESGLVFSRCPTLFTDANDPCFEDAASSCTPTRVEEGWSTSENEGFGGSYTVSERAISFVVPAGTGCEIHVFSHRSESSSGGLRCNSEEEINRYTVETCVPSASGDDACASLSERVVVEEW